MENRETYAKACDASEGKGRRAAVGVGLARTKESFTVLASPYISKRTA